MSARNLVCHCYKPSQSHDKVYMICIRSYGQHKWHVIAKWGRRGRKMNVQVKTTVASEAGAMNEATKMRLDRIKEGYLDIDTQKYREHMSATLPAIQPLTSQSDGIKENLEPETDVVVEAPAPIVTAVQGKVITHHCQKCGKEFVPKMERDSLLPDVIQYCPGCLEDKWKQKKEEDEVMVCIDNTGIEDRFDVGIEYIVEEHKDQKMLYAYDKLGRKDEYFQTRFMETGQWAIERCGRVLSKLSKQGDKIRIVGRIPFNKQHYGVKP